MLSTFSQLSLFFVLAINLPHVNAGIMVRSVDGSFVPLNFVARAPGEGLPILLKNNKDLAYLTTVLMGTPPQQIQMAASLSQDHISVASPPEGVTDGTFYNPTLSTSSHPIDASATIKTISGQTITGRFVGETCTLQSASSTQSFTYNASVVLTDSAVTSDMYPDGAHAILGYGVKAPDSPPGNSLIPTFLPHDFTNATCGIELNHFDDPVPDGILTMGAVDQTAFSGDFANAIVPASAPIAWSIAFDKLTYLSNGKNESISGSLSSIDIYHTGIEILKDDACKIYAGISGAKETSNNQWTLPCDSAFPITLTFAGREFTIPERDTIVKHADGTCTGVVTGGAQAIGKIGAPFLRNVYTQFGAVREGTSPPTFSVGFAQKVLRQTPAHTSASSSPKPSTSAVSSTDNTSTSGVRTRMTVHPLLALGMAIVSIVTATML